METNFAKRLVIARKMAGLSLQQLADKLGNDISRQASRIGKTAETAVLEKVKEVLSRVI